MRAALAKRLGGPIGRLRYDMLEMSSCADERPAGVRRLAVEDLPAAAEANLLARRGDHADRLRRGDRALGMLGPDGELQGIAWLNTVGHDDRYGGPWTAPDHRRWYLNQLLVGDRWRGRGVGRALARSARIEAASDGVPTIRLLVQPGNRASHALFAGEGARIVHRLVGIRLGRWAVRVRLPPVRSR